MVDVRITSYFQRSSDSYYFVSIQREKLRSIAAEITTSKNRIDGVINRNKVTEDTDVAHVQHLVHTLRVFETDFLVRLKDWDRVSAVVAVFLLIFFPHDVAVTWFVGRKPLNRDLWPLLPMKRLLISWCVGPQPGSHFLLHI